MKPSVIILGASGLVGQQVLRLLLESEHFGQVHALVRKSLGMPHPRLTEHLTDFEQLSSFALPKAEAMFCCLGTTIKVAGSQAAFKRVDFDYVLAGATNARTAGIKHFLMVSALGASSSSSVFYNRVKGETEASVKALAFPILTILRPSMLTGERKEFRPGERLTLALTQPLAKLIPAKYRPVADKTVARAMVAAAQAGKAGEETLESDQIQKFA